MTSQHDFSLSLSPPRRILDLIVQVHCTVHSTCNEMQCDCMYVGCQPENQPPLKEAKKKKKDQKVSAVVESRCLVKKAQVDSSILFYLHYICAVHLSLAPKSILTEGWSRHQWLT